MALELQLLGPFAAAVDGRPLDDFRSSKTQALLAYLVTEAGFATDGQARPHGREQLMTLLWPRTPQKSAQVNLRQTLYQLRQAIPDVAGPDGEAVPFILSDRQHIKVNPEARYELDVARFLRLLDGEPSPDKWAQAVTVYWGPFLADFHLPDSETFEEWAAARRATLQRKALEALEALTEHHLERAESEEAAVYARRQIALDELRESGHRQLMRALAQQGRRNAAVAHYETYADLLEEELGIAPSVEMDALYAAVREGQAAAVREGESEADKAPAVRAGRETGRKRRRLPHRSTPFVGRRREMEEVTAQLTGGCQLVTLLGPGGTGKTRLGIEVARKLSDRYRHGAAFVELAPLSDPGAVPTAIATALDFRFSGGASPREQLLNYLANKELLLVLDNVEHVLEGAGLVDDLLGVAPDVRLLATSRARLNLGAECLFEVGGLATSETGSEAGEMFIAYARRVQPGFDPDEKGRQAIARICRLVEGAPLAIELAASWVRALPPQEIARELARDLDFLQSERADLPPRQRSMRAAFDHSWKLLDEDAREALMELSVFRGGASRRAAAAVTGASLRTLLALADHSLLAIDPDSGRFAVHELIRTFAGERLEEAGDAETVRDAHSAYYLRALAGRLPDLKGRDQLGALEAIEGDFENVRAAWRWAVRQGQWEDFPEASQSLFLFAFFRERQLDGIELFEAACKALSSPTIPAEQLARAYATASGHWLLSWIGSHEEALAAVPDLETAVEGLADSAALAYCQMALGQVLIHRTGPGEYPAEAIAALGEARAYYQQARDPFYTALALWRLGYAHWRANQSEECFDLTRRGLALVREAGDRFVASTLLNNLGVALLSIEGPRAASERYYREAADLQREIGAWGQYAFSLSNLVDLVLWRDGDLEKTRPMVEEAHAIAVDQNELFTRTFALGLLSEHRMLEGRYKEASMLAAELLALAKKNSRHWCWAQFLRGVACLALGDIHDALSFMNSGLSWWKEDAHSNSRPAALFYCLAYCAIPLARHGEYEWAVELLAPGLTDPYFRGGLAIDPLLARTRAELEEALGEEAFAAAWARGRKLDPLVVMPEVMATLEEMEAAGDDTMS